MVLFLSGDKIPDMPVPPLDPAALAHTPDWQDYLNSVHSRKPLEEPAERNA